MLAPVHEGRELGPARAELVGHLPVYGVFLALLVYGSDPETAPHVRWLPSRRGVREAVTVTQAAA